MGWLVAMIRGKNWRECALAWCVAAILLIVAFEVVPRVTPYLPAWWWFDAREVRVASETQTVLIDRTINANFTGNLTITIRQISTDPGAPPTACSGGLRGIKFKAGDGYPASIPTGPRKGQPVDLAWLMNAPPNAGCALDPGNYVADFVWSRRWFGLPLQASAQSNIFHISGDRL